MPEITVTLALTREQATTGRVQMGGVLEFRPTARRVIAGVEAVLPEPFTVALTAGATAPTVVLEQDDGATWAWRVTERVSGGRGTWVTLTLSDVVGATAFYCDLTEVDPDTLVPVMQSPTTVQQALTAAQSAADAAQADATQALADAAAAQADVDAMQLTDNGDGTATITIGAA